MGVLFSGLDPQIALPLRFRVLPGVGKYLHQGQEAGKQFSISKLGGPYGRIRPKSYTALFGYSVKTMIAVSAGIILSLLFSVTCQIYWSG